MVGHNVIKGQFKELIDKKAAGIARHVYGSVLWEKVCDNLFGEKQIRERRDVSHDVHNEAVAFLRAADWIFTRRAALVVEVHQYQIDMHVIPSLLKV